MLARLDKPLRPTCAVKTAEAQLGGEDFSLQSLRKMSHGSTRFSRGGEATFVKTIGAL